MCADEFDDAIVDTVFVDLKWTSQQMADFTETIESHVIINYSEEGQSLQALNTTPEFTEFAWKVAAYAKQKFDEYTSKHRPIGWTHYDMMDMSEALVELFGDH